MEFEAPRTPEPEMLGVTAARGVGVLVGRTLGLQILTAGVTVVLARLLTPADYGLFAIALAVQIIGQRAAELGLPSALITLEEEPSAELQAATTGAMLSVSITITALFLLIGFVVLPIAGVASKTLEVVAVAIAAMPLYAARATPLLLMERHLKFGKVAMVETAETLAFNAFALAAAVAGLGAFSLTSAVVAGAAVGLVAALLAQPGTHRPTLDLDRIRPHAGFGLRVSVLQGIYLLKELGFVVLIAAIGGTAMAGFYSMAKRLFSFPIALTTAVGRVSLPALSRDPELRAGRATRIATTTALIAGLPLALVAGAAQPLIHVVLGDEWLPTTDIVVVGSLGMMLTAAGLSTMNSYALAEGRPNGPITSAATETALLCVLAITLVGSLSELGVGIALAASSLVATIVLAATTHPRLRRAMLPIAKSTLIAAAAVGAAQLLNVSNDVWGLAEAIGVVMVIWFGLEVALSRGELGVALSQARPVLQRARVR